jgi:hypothetical protein
VLGGGATSALEEGMKMDGMPLCKHSCGYR